MTRPRTHVFIIDGTLSRLTEGHESNAGLLYRLLEDVGPSADQTFGYDAGVQGEGWKKWLHVAMGVGVNRSIMQGYGMLCSRYQPGDRIMLFGFSRGAYAVRSLAGFIDQIGLLQRRHATERRILRAFRYYEAEHPTAQARTFSERYCRTDVPMEFIGVWDTVKALGLPYPLISRLAPMATEFHNHTLGHAIKNAYHALALDETRQAFTPLPWKHQPGWDGNLEQVWFAGNHADIGGHVWRKPKARGVSNIPLRWMLEKAQSHGLRLPDNWHDAFPIDPGAPSVGSWEGSAKYFWFRKRREAGACGSESEHASVKVRSTHKPRYRPKARWITSQTSSQTSPPAELSPPPPAR